MTERRTVGDGGLRLVVRLAMGAVLGAAAAFPVAVLSVFEWRAESEGDVPWLMWAQLVAGAAWGLLFVVSRWASGRVRVWAGWVLGVLALPMVLGWLVLGALIVQRL